MLRRLGFLSILSAFLFAQNPLSPGQDTFRPGDGVLIKLWRYPELSDTFQIDAMGYLHLPLVGDVRAEGMGWKELEDTLEQRFARYLKEPELTLTPMFRIKVLGQVKQPGVYRTPGGLTLVDIMAMARGPLPNADLRHVKIQRGSQILEVNLEDVVERGRTAADVGLRSGDIVYVPESRRLFRDWRDIYFILSAAALAWSLYQGIWGGR